MMKNSVLVIFLSVYVLVQLIKLSNAEPFEYMQFVLQYPLGVCYGTPKGDCKSRLPTKFTVHGIWPSNFSDTRVVCRQALISHPFDNAQMTSSLETDLTNSWPSVITKNSDIQFWQDEYEEHGACSVDKGVPPFTQKSYFERGNQLWNQYDIHALLDQSNIKPDSSKPCKMTEIVAAIQKKIGKNNTPVLRCKEDNKIYILREVIICLDHQAQNVITCPPKRVASTVCRDTKGEVYYVA